MNNGGDVLARGARSATYPASPKISQTKWDEIWDGYAPEKEYAVKRDGDGGESGNTIPGLNPGE